MCKRKKLTKIFLLLFLWCCHTVFLHIVLLLNGEKKDIKILSWLLSGSHPTLTAKSYAKTALITCANPTCKDWALFLTHGSICLITGNYSLITGNNSPITGNGCCAILRHSVSVLGIVLISPWASSTLFLSLSLSTHNINIVFIDSSE